SKTSTPRKSRRIYRYFSLQHRGYTSQPSSKMTVTDEVQTEKKVEVENGTEKKEETKPFVKCSGIDCEKEAGVLQCPTCLKFDKKSYFCSQDCFKRSWVSCHSYQHPFSKRLRRRACPQMITSNG